MNRLPARALARMVREGEASAAEKGLAAKGEVLVENRQMLSLMMKLGFTVRPSPADPTLSLVSKEL